MRSLLRGFFSLAAVRLLALPITLGTAIILARLLGPTDYGLFAFSLSLATLLALPVGSGLGQLLTRDIARAQKSGDLASLNGIRLRAMHLLLAYCALLVVLVVIPYFFGTWSLPVLAAALLAPILSLYELTAAILIGLGKPVRGQIPLLLLRPMAVLVAALFLWLTAFMTLSTVLGAQIIASLLVLTIAIKFSRDALPAGVTSITPRYQGAAWRRSYPTFMMIAGMSVLNIEIGIVILGMIGNPEAASGMRVAQSAGQLIVLPLLAANMMIQPRLATQTLQNETAPLFATYAHAGRLSVAGAALVGLPMFFLAEPLIRLTFGETYVELAATAIQVLVIGQIFNAAVGPSGMLLAMSGQESRALRAQLTGLLCTAVLAASLAGQFGASGAAIGITAGLIVKNTMECWYLHRTYGRWLSAFMIP